MSVSYEFHVAYGAIIELGEDVPEALQDDDALYHLCRKLGISDLELVAYGNFMTGIAGHALIVSDSQTCGSADSPINIMTSEIYSTESFEKLAEHLNFEDLCPSWIAYGEIS